MVIRPKNCPRIDAGIRSPTQLPRALPCMCAKNAPSATMPVSMAIRTAGVKPAPAYGIRMISTHPRTFTSAAAIVSLRRLDAALDDGGGEELRDHAQHGHRRQQPDLHVAGAELEGVADQEHAARGGDVDRAEHGLQVRET